MNILIVDDEKQNRTLLKAFMKKHGTCIEASNGREALILFKGSLTKKDPFDLVFLDILMPHKDGHATLVEMRDLERKNNIKVSNETKIIMCSSLDDHHNMIKATRHGGCTDYITKPIDFEKLLLKLRGFRLID